MEHDIDPASEAAETREELLPVMLTSPEGVSYRSFFDVAQQRAYIEPPEASPGPGGLMLVTDIFSAPATTAEEATTVLTAWGREQGWTVE